MKKTNLKTTAMGVILLLVSILVSTMLIRIPEGNIKPKNEMVEGEPKAVTFVNESRASEISSDVYARLKKAGFEEFAGFQASTQD